MSDILHHDILRKLNTEMGLVVEEARRGLVQVKGSREGSQGLLIVMSTGLSCSS